MGKVSAIGRKSAATLFSLSCLLIAPSARAQTPQQISDSTQRGINFLLPDTVNWIRAQNCTACHRSGISLYALSNAVHNGYSVPLDHTNGTGWLADRIVQDQQLNGQWSYDAQSGTRTAQTAHEIFGLGSYTNFSGDTSRIYNLTAAALWLANIASAQDYASLTFPNDGKVNAAQNVRYWTDCAYTDFPVVYSSISQTAKVMYGINASLKDDPSLSAVDRLALQNALSDATKWLEGYADRHAIQLQTSAGAGSTCGVLNGIGYNFEAGYALMGLAAGGKTVVNSTVVQNLVTQLFATRVSGSGWADFAYNQSNLANPFSTGVVVTGLNMVGAKMRDHVEIRDAVNFILAQQSLDGSWSSNELFTAFSLMAISDLGSLGVSVSSAPSTAQQALLNQQSPQTLTYTLTITNSGAFAVVDTYGISASGGLPGWTAALSQSSLTLASGASATVTVTITAPANLVDSLPDNRTITVTSGMNSAISAKIAVNSYSGNPPPVTGDRTNLTIPPASQNLVASSRSQAVHFSAAVTDLITNLPVVGSGKGAVIFYVGGNAVGIAKTGDSNGSFAFDWTPGYNWTLTGQQALQVLYSGVNTGDSTTSLLPSSAASNATLSLKPLATASVTSTAFVYDGTPKSVAILTSPANVTIQTVYKDINNQTVAQPSQAGVYSATVTVTDSNYDALPATGTLTISQGAISVTAANASRAYWDPNPTFTGTFTGSVPADGITALYTTSADVNSVPGSYNIAATLLDPNNKLANYSVTQQAGTLTIVKASTTAAITFAPASPSFGQNLVLTATVTPSRATGIVTFKDAGTVIGTATLASGSGSLTVSSLSVSSHSITADYGGDGNHNGTSAPAVAIPVGKAAAAITLGNAPSQPVFGQNVTITATFTGSPTGTVNFTDSATAIGTGTLASGAVSINVPNLSVGAHTITASYGGDGSNNAGSSTFTVTVVKATATFALTGSPNTPSFGQALTLTATLTTSAGAPTGTVIFSDGGVAIGTSPVTSGTATLVINNPSAITHSYTASYSGDASFNSGSAAVTVAVSKASTSLALASSPINPAFGQVVTLTGTLTFSTGAPTGAITFSEGGTAIGSANVASGVASLNVSSLGVGPHTITAMYAGDGSFGSSSGSLTITVVKATAALSLLGSPNTVAFGQALTLTGTLTVGAGIPTGTLTFSDGATVIGTATVAAGTAAVSISTLAVAAHAISVTYSGDGSFNAASASLTISVGRAGTTLSLSATPNLSTFGQSILFTASIGVGATAPTGTITFTDGVTVIGSAPVAAGSASITFGALAVGAHTITASYGGDGSYSSSSASLNVPVAKANVSLALSDSPNPVAFGQALTLTTVLTTSAGTPGGTVTFTDFGNALGTASVSAGRATLTLATLPVGAHSFAAAYSGDGSFNANSATLSDSIGKGLTTLAMSASPSSVLFGQPVTLGATISVIAGTPTGTVTFLDAGSPIGTSSLISGVATLIVSNFGVGSHSLTAQYGGDGSYNSALGSAGLTIGKASTSVALTIAPNPSVYGQAMTFTASLTVGVGTPSGTVTFQDGTTVIGTATVNGQGVAALSLSGTALAVSSHSISATYSGNDSYAVGTSAALLLNVYQPVSFNPSALTLSAPSGGALAVGTILLTNGGVPLSYTLSVVPGTGGNWLSVLPSSGSTNTLTPVIYSANPAGLLVGSYTATIRIVPSVGVAQTIPVTFNVGPPALLLNIASLLFERLVTDKPIPAQTLTLAINGGPLSYSLISSASWLHLSSSGGTLVAGQIVPVNLVADPSGLAVGVFSANILISVPGANPAQITIPVTLRVPFLSVVPDPSIVRSAPAQGAINNGRFAFTATAGSNAPASIQASQSLRARLPASALRTLLFGRDATGNATSASGDYITDSVLVTGNGGNWNFTASGTTDNGGNWLTLSPSNGTTPSAIRITVDKTGLAPGLYTGTVLIHSVSQGAGGQSDITLPVSFTISAQASGIGGSSQGVVANPIALNFNYELGGQTLPSQQTLTLAGLGASTYFAALSGGSWATMSSASGTLPAALTIQVNPAGLPAGEYTVLLTLTTPGIGTGPVVVPLHLSVQAQSILTVQPGSVQLSAETGSASSPVTIQVGSSAGRALSYTASTSAPWISLSQTTGTTTQQLTIKANASSLAAGTYSATVNIVEAGGTGAQITVTLTVIDKPQLVTVGGPLVFQAVAGSSGLSDPQLLYVTSKNRQVAFAASATTMNGGNWIDIAVSGGLTQTPANIMIRVRPDGLAPGHYVGSVVLTSKDLPLPMLVPVTLDVLPGSPVLTSAGIVNAASMVNGAVSPNEIVTVFGSNLTCGSNPVQVMLDGQPVPILAGNATQLSVLVPASIANDASVGIKMACGASVTPELQMTIQSVMPAIFTQTQTGIGAGAILNQDRQLNQASLAAAPQSVVMLFVTGFGTLNSPSADGLSRLSQTVTAMVGGLPADVIYSGEAPGLTPGLQQINVSIPGGLQSGPISIQLTIGGRVTQDGVTVFLQ